MSLSQKEITILNFMKLDQALRLAKKGLMKVALMKKKKSIQTFW